MTRLVAILWGSVITAAFIGPGTVTTAAQAGAHHGYRLLWSLVFATLACLVLQEASARLTIVSGRELGEALRLQHPDGAAGRAVRWLVAGSIVLGCAAYEAGNILGGVAGANLATDLAPRTLTVLSVVVAGLLLGTGSVGLVAGVLSALVGVMGVGFLVTAVLLEPAPAALVAGLVIPAVPAGSGLLVLGLIGTTVVPYNLFLGSGTARGRPLPEMRFGLAVAIGLGGLISMAVVVAGAAIAGEFSFAAVAQVLTTRLGGPAGNLFAWGLFAAGFSSAITAPLAAAMTVRSLFARDAAAPEWAVRSWRFRAVWLGVLAVGAVFGLSGVQPVPVILLAQALNGVLLPLVAVFLLLVMNDRRLLGAAVNGLFSNLAMAVAVAATVFLGMRGLLRAASVAAGWPLLANDAVIVGVSSVVLVVLAGAVGGRVVRLRLG